MKDVMMKYLEMSEFWVDNILDNKEDYKIDQQENENFLCIKINVNQEKFGRIIGKNGRIISSLRTLVSSVAKKDKVTVKIEVKEL